MVKHLEKGSPVKPWRQLQIGLWLITSQRVFCRKARDTGQRTSDSGRLCSEDTPSSPHTRVGSPAGYRCNWAGMSTRPVRSLVYIGCSDRKATGCTDPRALLAQLRNDREKNDRQ